MGKAQKKTGKGRLDKYYKLAKEQGYRARSAFKLIQLNRKYSFLESARCCIDLCAAPGGWLQVASKYMPANSIIVGVDLVPIRPIPRVVTFASDITTTQCRNQLRGELKDWKADVVLHDGAPNVGTAWVQDAYSQSELVLMSLKLAVEFLSKGGTFVTKVFRSVDYNNLVWVFSQLFGKVEATKPPSSRNVSAEIFVVCRDFLAPKHVDPKFLDPKHVFKDLSATSAEGAPGVTSSHTQANVFMPEKRRRHRDGYDDGDYTLFKQLGASDFIRSPDPISILGSVNQILFGTEEEKGWLSMRMTTPDIKANCDDLKVLGKGDFKMLLKWRMSLREELGLDLKTTHAEELTEHAEVEEEDVDEETQIETELERLNQESAARLKRERRRANELKTKTIQRMQLQMTAPLDIGLEQHDASLGLGQEDVFDLNGATEAKLRLRNRTADLSDDEMSTGLQRQSEEDEQDDLSSDEEQELKVSKLESMLDGMYGLYQEKLREKDAKYKVKEGRKKGGLLEEWNGVQDGKDEDEESDASGGWDKVQEAKHAGDSSGDESDEDDSNADDDDDEPPRKKLRHHQKTEEPKGVSRAAQLWFKQDIFQGMEVPSEPERLEQEVSEDEEDVIMGSGEEMSDQASSAGGDFEVVPQDPEDDGEGWDAEGEDVNKTTRQKIQKSGLITAEAASIAERLVNRQTTKTHLINEGFNRYSLNDKDGLPAWFLDDEAKYYKPNIPISKEAVAALRARQRALDARPIKKIAEAKGRKKLRAAQRLEKAMKKAEGVNATEDLSEREKARQIETLLRKGASKAKKKEVKVVVAKGAHKGIKGRPKGVKGKYAMVDARMKKEVRAKKRKDAATKKRKRT